MLVFFRKDELMTLGISEKAELRPAGDKDGFLIQQPGTSQPSMMSLSNGWLRSFKL